MRHPMSCPCGGPSLETCCGPYISGEKLPPTAEALMRSRYTAYATQQVDYVLATHDPANRDEVDPEGAATWAREAEWQGLEIVATEAGGPVDDTGVVEFIARYAAKGAPVAHHERSTFKKIDGRWFYMDGDMVKPRPVVRDAPRTGRNDPCPCGSGKKYKKCHGAS